ncbi:MAG: hypothetical protein HY553_17485 [Elusimicrobia bacterium]|nr:hypothetical protein [Elusimicrobiota bacterium]
MPPGPQQRLGLQTSQRLALLGRLRMAEWIQMPEREFARQVEDIEKDPLFRKLFFSEGSGVIRRQRWPGGRYGGSLYELQEGLVASGERVKVEEALGDKAELLPLIRKMGRENFERYFLYCEEGVPLEEIAKRTDLPVEAVRQIHDLLLEIGAQAEFFLPARDPGMARSYSCLARLSIEGDEASYEFFQPYWARGLYQVRYDLLEDWKRSGKLEANDRRRLRHLLKRIEIVNLRQNTLFRILESLTRLQTEFLGSRRDDRKRPISLRMLARRLQLAPSNVSRAVAGRSVRMPWGQEVPLITLMPGRRNVVREVLARWLAEPGPRPTDSEIASRLRREYGIQVSRRTVNAARHEVVKSGRV